MAASAATMPPAEPGHLAGAARQVMEWSYTSGRRHADPFHDVTLDGVISAPDNSTRRLPAFWAGGNTWKVRFAADVPGRYTARSVASGAPDLHDIAHTLEIAPYTGSNPLARHGRLRVASGGRHFEHSDGTPFFWLGDTWWMALCQRLQWPGEFRSLTADRVAKGFSVIQIIAGLYPDMPPFDPRGANEAGYPWTPEYGAINPAYFDMADLRIAHLIENGVVVAAPVGY